ncbi:MAG: YigZ family protein [Firmicutes bacterium]|nr:YigZ family protein [Bacillota bacterium]
MMIRYSTILKEGQAELIIEKSRFIGYVKPVESREEADAFIKEIKTRHRDATHNVPAFVLGEKFQQQCASDDGEPQGTSGVPMLQMMVKEGITNVVVVVTRYFGGIKLGTGGLVRAYTNTAKAALEDAGIHQVKDQTVIVASMDYTYLGKLQNAEKDGYFTIADTAFTDVITVTLHSEPEDAERVKGFLSELTGGKYVLVEQLETLV